MARANRLDISREAISRSVWRATWSRPPFRERQPDWRGSRNLRWRASENRCADDCPFPRPPVRPHSLRALKDSLVALGLQPDIDFVYAAFDDRAAGGHAIYYHGRIEGPAPTGFRIVPLGDLPIPIWQMPPRPRCSRGSPMIFGMGSSASITAMKPQARSGGSRAPMLKTEGKSDVASRTPQGR